LYAGAYSILDSSYSFDGLCSIAEGVSKACNDVVFVMACRIRTVKDLLLEKNFKAMVTERGLAEKFVFLNTVKDMAGLIRECDIGIMPAKDRMAGVLETPMALLEMACMSKCVVYSDVAPLDELYANGIGAMLPAQSLPGDYAKAILDLIGDERKYAFVADRSRQAVLENFNIVKMADRYREIYDSLKG
jgi:glycosyltransferase involved in cell wall biosynthesis